jgi:CheY-like chemotaxis protein
MKIRILHAEDNLLVAELFRIHCEKEFDCEITHVLDGIPALQKLKEEEFDVIVSDNHMTKMNGTRFLMEAKKLFPEVGKKFIIFTGNVSEVNEKLEYLKLEAFRVINKCDYNGLIEAIKQIINK